MLCLVIGWTPSAAAQTDALGMSASGSAAGGSAASSNNFSGQTSSAPRSAPSGQLTATDAQGLLGLSPPRGPKRTLALPDVLKAVDEQAPDTRIALERVIQQEAQLRRAWAMLLPTLTVSGAYVHNCQAGGDPMIFCGDRTTTFVSQSQIEQQALLFNSLADITGVAADVTTDPGEQAELRERQQQLLDAADAARSTEVRPVVVQPASQWNGTLAFQMPLFNGRAFPLLLNAYTGVDATKLAAEQTRQTLRYQAARAYYGAITAQKLVEAARRQLEASTRHRDATAARVEARTQPALALRRAELEVLRARQSLRNAESGAEATFAALGILIGTTERFDVAPAPLAQAAVEGGAADLLTQALEKRPDVRLQRAAKLVAQRSQADAWSMFLPSVNLGATARATSFTAGFVKDPITATLSIQASLPLYDGGVRYAALRETSSKLREETIRLTQVEERASAQVRGNLRELAVRQEALTIAREATAVARQAHEQAQALFDNGLGTSLDVSDTNLVLFVSETDELRAELDIALARIGVDWAVGTPIGG